MIDVLLLAIVGLVTWLVASDGPWGAVITFVSVLLSGLLAMNFFEPLANFLGSTVMTSYDWQHRWDVIALLGIFAGSVTGLRVLGEYLLPTYAELHIWVYEPIRWGFAALTGYLTMAIICTSLHVAPLQREFLGFTPERGNFFGLAPDRQWLAFTQYASENSLKTKGRDGQTVLFDGIAFPSNPDDGATRQVWSSFPIKYAARRQRFSTGMAAAAPAAPLPPPPSGGGGGGSPTGGVGGF